MEDPPARPELQPPAPLSLARLGRNRNHVQEVALSMVKTGARVRES